MKSIITRKATPGDRLCEDCAKSFDGEQYEPCASCFEDDGYSINWEYIEDLERQLKEAKAQIKHDWARKVNGY